MSAKIIIVFCAQALFVQTALSQQCTSRAAVDASKLQSSSYWMGPSVASPAIAYDRLPGSGMAYNGLGSSWAGRYCDGLYSPAVEFTTTSGGGLPVTSVSAISPTGISVKSDNAYEGAVMVTGELPFLSAVAMEGKLPTVGAGAIDYGCGNGVVAMLSEGVAPSFGPVGYGSYGPGPIAAFGLGSGFGSGAGLSLGNGFGPVTGLGSPASFATANRLGYGGCGRGMLY